MKNLFSLVIFMGIVCDSFCQLPCLSVSTTKTTSLVFPLPISHVDRGTMDILVQPVREAKNILLLKAAVKSFSTTNISIVTSDGNVYGFMVEYNANPKKLVYHISTENKNSAGIYAQEILDNPRWLHGIIDRSWGIKGRLSGIYIKDNTIYYHLSIENNSPLDYDIGFIRFYLRDKERAKRAATQEVELFPVSEAGNRRVVHSHSASSIVVAFKKFTIPNSRYLAIDLHEESGGRNLLMKVNNRKLIKARAIGDIK